jgi:rare lipoprotein A
VRAALGGGLILLSLLAACKEPPPPPRADPRYVIGQPYAMGGVWSYPREDFARQESGLAVVLPDRSAGRRTANGEIHDPAALVAAHRSLQLPAIVTVTNLENGRSLQVRLNDRGPQDPARMVGLSRRAAELLGVPAGGAAQVRLAVEGEPSRALAAALPSTDRTEVPIAATPVRAGVEREEWAPPPGARAVARQREGRIGAAMPAMAEAPVAALPPERLPERLVQGPAAPGRLLLEAGTFFRRDLAQGQVARLASLGAWVEQTGRGRQAEYRVRLGPFASVAEADRTFAAALAAGLPELRLLVE